MDTTTLVIIIVAAVILLAAIAAFFAMRQRRAQQERQEQAREEYGPEYERTVEERGSARKAERDLRERRERLESDVRPLSEESRGRYEERWHRVEQTFVDDPETSLRDADRVVRDIMQERNFPTESRQEASKGVGVMHPQVVEDYREAQRVHEGVTGSGDERDLEQMRQAIQKYRSVYERLLRD